MRTTLQLPAGLRRMLVRALARPLTRSQPATRRKAFLYKVDLLGDFVLATGALRLLVRHYGADHCRLVVSRTAAALAAAEFPGVEQWTIPGNVSGAWREMRPLRREIAPVWSGESAETLVCLRHMPNLYRDLTLSWLSADQWIGLGSRPTPETLSLHNRPAPPAGYPPVANLPWSKELLAHRTVLNEVLGRVPDWEEIKPALTSVQPTSGTAWVFCPFGSEAIRDYPADSWITAWRAAGLPTGPVQLIGPRSRHMELERLATRLRAEVGRETVEVATDLPPPEFIARIAGARGVITVDSAAAHLATALDKKAVIVIGGGHDGAFGPWGHHGKQRWVAHPLECYGCNWACIHPTVRCLVDLPATAVAEALKAIAHG